MRGAQDSNHFLIANCFVLALELSSARRYHNRFGAYAADPKMRIPREDRGLTVSDVLRCGCCFVW
jgi:hypothetical protein